jgi:hypothetical protein
VYGIDAAGHAQPLASAHAILDRNPPAGDGRAGGDALSFLLAGDALPKALSVESYDTGGRKLDALAVVPLAAHACPDAALSGCLATPAIRAVADAIDRDHPLVRGRSIVAELGGALVLRVGGKMLGRVRVAGPAHDRLRARLRFVMVRLAPGGAIPVGGDRAGAVAVARAAVARANALWGSCGVSFGPPERATVEVVDPPPPHLVAIGCAHGLPASGGALELVVAGKPVRVPVDPGMLPRAAARRLAVALERAGFVARVSDNPRIAAGAHPTADVLVRTARGELVELAAPPPGVSSDATLGACLGAVDLEDGLQHFGDVDSAVGTLEERTLLKAYDDFDPTTIEVYMVPGFARGGRIGESFIASDRGSIMSTVLLDRAGVRSNRASFTLAHELGHVLLDDPGHPDDYALDTPTRLMDADASDPTAFGPRRLSRDECARAVRQSGPAAPVRLLSEWPLDPLEPK